MISGSCPLAFHRPPANVATAESLGPVDPVHRRIGTGLGLGDRPAQGGDVEDPAACGDQVIAPLLGIIGSIQALETIKVITRVGNDLSGRLLLLDSLAMDWHTMKFKKDPKCPVCSQ